MSQSLHELYAARAALAFTLETQTRIAMDAMTVPGIRETIQQSQSLVTYADLQRQIATAEQAYAAKWQMPGWRARFCDHALADIISSDEGTSYCSACEEEARDR